MTDNAAGRTPTPAEIDAVNALFEEIRGSQRSPDRDRLIAPSADRSLTRWFDEHRALISRLQALRNS